MQNWKEDQVHISGESILVSSWRDTSRNIWWARAPQYFTDWCGTNKTSRLEVIQDLTSLLSEYIELVGSEDGELGDDEGSQYQDWSGPGPWSIG